MHVCTYLRLALIIPAPLLSCCCAQLCQSYSQLPPAFVLTHHGPGNTQALPELSSCPCTSSLLDAAGGLAALTWSLRGFGVSKGPLPGRGSVAVASWWASATRPSLSPIPVES